MPLHNNRFYGIKIRRAVRAIERALAREDKVVQHRLKVLTFYKEYGVRATLKAFEISKSTLYNWRKLYNELGCKGLGNMSRRPVHKRESSVPLAIIEEIRGIREKYPRLNQTAVQGMLRSYCQEQGYRIPSPATIARIIKRLKEEGKILTSSQLCIYARTGTIHQKSHRYKVKQRRGSYAPSRPGELLQIDSVHVFMDGIKRYIITAIDIQTRFAFSYCYSTLSSANAKDFLDKVQQVYPYAIQRVQTDNGLEFHKYFDEALSKRQLVHYFNYPQSPKSNAFIERFNRTLREQFINVHRESFYDREEVNRKLMEYLIWYNTQRPHQSLHWMTPIDYTLKALGLSAQKSNMYRYHTASCKMNRKYLQYIYLNPKGAV